MIHRQDAPGAFVDRFLRRPTLRLKALPHAKGLIGAERRETSAIGTQNDVKNAFGVTRQFGNFRHLRILPYGDLILGETVSGDELAMIRRPNQATDLKNKSR